MLAGMEGILSKKDLIHETRFNFIKSKFPVINSEIPLKSMEFDKFQNKMTFNKIKSCFVKLNLFWTECLPYLRTVKQ